ncbi:MAG: hypothetical protein NHB14_27245 [Desulfosporosinus sp.]|nr:hypothetical protein [Desulfosporosinus sp.]
MPAVKPDIIGVAASLITWGIKQLKGKGIQDVIGGGSPAKQGRRKANTQERA